MPLSVDGCQVGAAVRADFGDNLSQLR